MRGVARLHTRPKRTKCRCCRPIEGPEQRRCGTTPRGAQGHRRRRPHQQPLLASGAPRWQSVRPPMGPQRSAPRGGCRAWRARWCQRHPAPVPTAPVTHGRRRREPAPARVPTPAPPTRGQAPSPAPPRARRAGRRSQCCRARQQSKPHAGAQSTALAPRTQTCQAAKAGRWQSPIARSPT